MAASSCVLVVEDDVELREGLADLVEALGYGVVTAANGQAALEKMKALPPCIVLLDLMMPVMDGWQLWEVMKADAALKHVQVCVMSAQWQQAPNDIGCVFPKPIPTRRLVETLSQHCQRCDETRA